MVLPNVSKNLSLFLSAQQEAEREKKDRFQCPVCGGPAAWTRSDNEIRFYAVCRGCGMYLRGR